MTATIMPAAGRQCRNIVFILDDIHQLEKNIFSELEREYIENQFNNKKKIIQINRFSEFLYIVFLNNEKERHIRLEDCRKAGFDICGHLNDNKQTEIAIKTVEPHKDEIIALAEGLVLSNYKFNKYQTEKKDNTLESIIIEDQSFNTEDFNFLNATLDATCWARDLVNEPVNKLNAEELARQISEKVRSVGGKAEVFNKKKIETLKMGGLLAVNAGSQDEPTFTILEWKPDNAVNANPVVLVGKGIVFDTGGYNLKTGSIMDDMKDDMSGAASVAASVYATAKAKLPVHVIALVPATDNRIDGNAHVTGDVITMYDGTTVEILNTDAEGRLILADALSYAKHYNPMCVFDFATLTGAASRAIGPLASVVMEKDADKIYSDLEQSGFDVFERLVKFPMWEDYGELIKSDIADIKNTGAPFAGMIMAGKFLEHFTDYPWVHFDIAATAFLEHKDSYRGIGGTGIHVRLLADYFRKMAKTK
ncbi:MAG: peptidase M17 [Bacteroidales bacterium]|nr:peptidase M17 [Bacteroidales bacterium]